MDRWITSELNALVRDVDSAYASFDSQEVGRLLAVFIDDLSNWYVRRSRRRFWAGESAALETLFTCLKTLTQLMSPMVPFITEHVWQVLVRAGEASSHESVHLTSFPTFETSVIDEKLSTSVALSRRLVELGRSARAESKIKIRQPLARALVAATGWKVMDAEIRSHVAEELNVLSLEELSSENEDLASVSIKANFRTIGARYGADVQEIAKAVTDSDATALVREVRSNGQAKITYGTSSAQITEEDLVITETPKEGWSVASHSGESLALDLTLTPELIEAGLMREVIRSIQEERKNSGFDISDRIIVEWSGSSEMAQAINKYSKEISDEVLAVSIIENKSLPAGSNEIALGLSLKRAN